jgi:hypothetical protein
MSFPRTLLTFPNASRSSGDLENANASSRYPHKLILVFGPELVIGRILVAGEIRLLSPTILTFSLGRKGRRISITETISGEVEYLPVKGLVIVSSFRTGNAGKIR